MSRFSSVHALLALYDEELCVHIMLHANPTSVTSKMCVPDRIACSLRVRMLNMYNVVAVHTPNVLKAHKRYKAYGKSKAHDDSIQNVRMDFIMCTHKSEHLVDS